jgi:hypothetical protein
MGRWIARTAVRAALLAVLTAAPFAGAAADPPTPAAAALRQRFAELRGRPKPAPFDAPVYLTASDVSGRLQGDVHALVDRTYAQARGALERADEWCRILILHLNVKYCRLARGPQGDVLDVGIGRKYDQPLASVHWLRFAFELAYAGDDYLYVVLRAPTGPLDTHDYRLRVEVVPLQDGSLLHVAYAYSYGPMASLAMHAYLATLGWDKVGFSVVGRQSDGEPLYVGGLQGVIERNVMRYFLAVDAHLAARALPDPQRLDASLQRWYDAAERHPRQLHEIERSAYLEMKRREVRRQEDAAAQ